MSTGDPLSQPLTATSARHGESEKTEIHGEMEGAPAEESKNAMAEPYSFEYEIKFFFQKGVPLGLSSFLEWGFPSLFTMLMAGQTSDSSDLQSALGFGRVFYNITIIMPIVAMIQYLYNVVPGCIGAKRTDRIAGYFQRSVLLSTIAIAPMLILQLFAGDIMAGVGVRTEVAHNVGVYCRLMIVPAYLMLVEAQAEAVFTGLGYVKCCAFNSLVTGVGVDCVSAFFFIYHLDLGVRGAAYTQIAVKLGRCTIWMVLIAYFKLSETFFVNRTELLLVKREVKVFISQCLPALLSNFSNWLLFELQILAMANISQIPEKAITAGAVWVQMETLIAATQSGWCAVTSIRTVMLLGRGDGIGAAKAFVIICLLSAVIVAVTNVPLLVWREQLAQVVSNDAEVRYWFEKIVWVLALQAQIRVSSIGLSCLLVPLGKGHLSVGFSWISTYVLTVPVVAVGVLTDSFTNSVQSKMELCLSSSFMAGFFSGLFGLVFLISVDWPKMAEVIASRANSDKAALESDGTQDGSAILYKPVSDEVQDLEHGEPDKVSKCIPGPIED
eukprot:TRINITY_DN21906_c0_g1_i2.p1 TRINITY_DN21906_c0_g1~~TRINITY_DN21906_c0_g1_i2.p1  ORF type:complete len:554 (+),score=131.34 TRINITY_DN21906_c0_g1_i2:17-1678(+)